MPVSCRLELGPRGPITSDRASVHAGATADVDHHRCLIKALPRAVAVAIVFAPTRTKGGNGQAVSVALYDFIICLFDADPVYARQAAANAAVAALVVWPLLGLHYRRGPPEPAT